MTADWKLWRRQLIAVLRLELKKSFFNKRAWWIWLLALAPVLITGAHSLVMYQRGHWSHTLAQDSTVFASMFHVAYLRMIVFFGCVIIFTSLFRGEILEKTLHYYLLAPVRREVLVAGKYLSGLTAAIVFFAGSAALSFILIHLHFGADFAVFLFQGEGHYQLSWYTLVAVLACAGYGAVFLVMGLLFRNPMMPAALIMVWEAVNPFLPSLLKKISVTFYLKSLSPVDAPQRGLMALLSVSTDPTPAWLAIPGLLALTLLLLAAAARMARHLEIGYSD